MAIIIPIHYWVDSFFASAKVKPIVLKYKKHVCASGTLSLTRSLLLYDFLIHQIVCDDSIFMDREE